MENVTQRVVTRPDRVPPWYWRCLAEWASGRTYAEIGAACGKSETVVHRALCTPWMREERRKIRARQEAEGRALAQSPVEKFQAAGPRMADILLGAAEEAAKPMERAVIAEKALALGGWTPVQRSVHLDLTAKLRDRRVVSDEELLAFVNGGEVPEALAGAVGEDDGAPPEEG